jgi:heme-degrading monooxygenase HmoA
VYATRQSIMVAPGKFDAVEARIKGISALQQAQPGFNVRRVLQSLGYPAKITILTYWDSRDAARAAIRSRAFTDWLAANPADGLTTSSIPVEAYDVVHEVTGSAATDKTPGHVTLVEWTLNPGLANAEAFEQSRRDAFALQVRHNPGFIRHRLLRFLGSPGRYLVINANVSLDALREAMRVPDIARFTEAHPASTYAATPPVIEAYEPLRIAGLA